MSRLGERRRRVSLGRLSSKRILAFPSVHRSRWSRIFRVPIVTQWQFVQPLFCFELEVPFEYKMNWMGGSRRRVSNPKKAVQAKQKSYFEKNRYEGLYSPEKYSFYGVEPLSRLTPAKRPLVTTIQATRKPPVTLKLLHASHYFQRKLL